MKLTCVIVKALESVTCKPGILFLSYIVDKAFPIGIHHHPPAAKTGFLRCRQAVARDSCKWVSYKKRWKMLT